MAENGSWNVSEIKLKLLNCNDNEWLLNSLGPLYRKGRIVNDNKYRKNDKKETKWLIEKT